MSGASKLSNWIDDGTDLSPKQSALNLKTGNLFRWRESIIDKTLSTPPVSPSLGDRYIVAIGGSGDWAGQDTDIAEFNGTIWEFTTSIDGFNVYLENENVSASFDGSVWTSQKRSNVVKVNSIEDFPAASGGVITLVTNTCYEIGADITTSNRFVMADNSGLKGCNSIIPALTYSGTGAMFTGTDVSVFLRDVMVGGPNCSQIFSFSNTVGNTHSFEMLFCTLSASPKIGTFADMIAVVFELVNATLVTDGFTLSGTGTVFSIEKYIIFPNATGIGIDMGDATFTTIEIRDMVAVGTAGGSIGISGLTSSGNVPTGFLGEVSNCEFLGAITPLSGITISDTRWNFSQNSGVSNSTKTGDTFLTASRTVPIGTQSQFEQINGTDWSSEITERFTVTTAGVLTYEAERDDNFMVVATATVEKDGGGTDEIEVRISVNGTDQSKTGAFTQNNTPTSVTAVGIFTLSENDTIQLEVANNTSTTDIIVNRANVSIINGF